MYACSALNRRNSIRFTSFRVKLSGLEIDLVMALCSRTDGSSYPIQYGFVCAPRLGFVSAPRLIDFVRAPISFTFLTTFVKLYTVRVVAGASDSVYE